MSQQKMKGHVNPKLKNGGNGRNTTVNVVFYDSEGKAMFTLEEFQQMQQGQIAYNAVISYMLDEGYMEEPMAFLRCWNEGDFDALRREWPDAPQAIYLADPLADHEAILATLNQEE